MNILDETVQYDSSESAGDFLDTIAETLAKALKFDNHGSLTESEQTAFVWGFRYGIHQMNALLSQASKKDEKSFYMICDIMTKACSEWQLKATAQIAMILPLPKVDETER